MRRIAVLRLWVVLMACLISASACLVAAKPARAATFSAGDRVVVINTTGSGGAAVGLKVRSSPAGTQVASKYDGTTGSIISGPVNSALEDGLTYAWWEVRWGDDGVQGWSAERYPVTNGVSYLQRQSKPVSTRFSAGQQVRVINMTSYDYRVRSNPPGLSTVTNKHQGDVGTVQAGPYYGVPDVQGTPPVAKGPGGDYFYYFWQIRWADGQTGWSAEGASGVSYLEAAPSQYSLSTAVSPAGAGSVNPGGASYNPGTDVTVTATSGQGWVFDHWEGDVGGTSNPVTVVVDGSKSVTACFVRAEVPPEPPAPLEQYTLGTEVSPAGAGSVSPSGGSYGAGTPVTLTAWAGPGWAFDHWEGDVAGTSNPVTVVMDSGKSVRACFVRAEVPQYTLSTAVSPAGAGSVEPSGGSYSAGTVVTLTANAGSGWAFDHWEGGASGRSNPVVITMDSSKAVTASFVVSAPASAPTTTVQPFLTFPLPGRTASSATINSVFDHDPSDAAVVAYTGEAARKGNDAVRISGTDFFGYRGTGAFSVNGHYSGGSVLYYDGHAGHDFETNDQGSRVRVLAAAGGTAHRGSASYGTVYIDHGNGYRTYYYHLLNESRIADGRVSAGQQIGIAGGTGPGGPDDFGVHLHFEVRKQVGSQWIEVDPYGWRGPGADPYGSRATNVNLWLDAGNSTPSDVTPGEGVVESSLGIPSDFRFTQNLSVGSSGPEVRYLQIVLNMDPETRVAASGAGSPGNETDYFGGLTEAALRRFQEKYAAEILTPAGLSAGTGVVAERTRARLNQILDGALNGDEFILYGPDGRIAGSVNGESSSERNPKQLRVYLAAGAGGLVVLGVLAALGGLLKRRLAK